jgi:subtilisin
MRIRTIGVLVGLAALGVNAQGPQERNPVVPPDLAAQAALGPPVSVIVGLRTPGPTGDLSGADVLAVQRAVVRRSLDEFVATVRAEGMSIGHRLQNLPFVSMRVTADQLKQLSAMPGVESIREDAVDRIMLAQSVPLVGAPAAWAAGATGAGWTVALLDTGVDTAHPFLAGKVTGEACFSNAGGAGGGTSLCPGGAPSATGAGSGVNCDPAIAGCEHGTHLAGIIAGANGPGGMSGVAPGANLISIQVFTRGDDVTLCGTDRPVPCLVSFASDQAAALDHVLTLAGPGNSNRVAAVNLSLGGGHYTDHLGCVALNPSRAAGIESLRTLGIASVAAAGNDGYTNALPAPACLAQLAIPASTKSDRMAAFSNRSSTPIVAPGEAINSSVPGGLFVARSGTSQAAAHVSGAVAVLKQAFPAMTVSQAFVALSTSGNNIFDPLTNATYFRLRVDQARTLLLGGAADVPGVPGRPTAIVSGGAVTLSWTPPSSGGAVTRYIIEAGTYSGATNIGSFTVGLTTTVSAAPGAGLY